MSEKCVFCKIIKGELPGKFAYKDDTVVAFYDINPQAPVHVLVVPKKHIPNLVCEDASNAQLLSQIFSVIQKLSKELNLMDGFRVVVNCGAKGGQTVDHIHFHLLGGRAMHWPPG